MLLMHRTPHRVSLESIPHSRDAMLIAAPRKQHTTAVMKITWKLTSSLGMFLKDFKKTPKLSTKKAFSSKPLVAWGGSAERRSA